jgi:hypothetical protein
VESPSRPSPQDLTKWTRAASLARSARAASLYRIGSRLPVREHVDDGGRENDIEGDCHRRLHACWLHAVLPPHLTWDTKIKEKCWLPNGSADDYMKLPEKARTRLQGLYLEVDDHDRRPTERGTRYCSAAERLNKCFLVMNRCGGNGIPPVHRS